MKRSSWLTGLLVLCGLVFAHAQTSSFQWVNKGGGSGNSTGFSCHIDAAGNVFTAGKFYGPGIFGNTFIPVQGPCFFLAKYDAWGALQWVQHGRAGIQTFCSDVIIRSITGDQQGNIYAAGEFSDSLVTGNTSLASSLPCTSNPFIAKYDNNGNLLWIKKAAATNGMSQTHCTAADNSGNIYISGFSNSDTLDFGNGHSIYYSSQYGNTIPFLAKMDANGNCQWASYNKGGTSIAINAAGNIAAAGTFAGSLTQGVLTLSSSGINDNDIYIAEYDPSGNVLQLKQAGGPGQDAATGITADASGNIYLAGYFSLSCWFDNTGITSNGANDGFLAKYDNSFNAVWATNIGSTGSDVCRAVKARYNTVYVTGAFTGSLTQASSTLNAASASAPDVFLSSYDSAGTLLWSKRAGGSQIDEVYSVAIGPGKRGAITGTFQGTAGFDANNVTSSYNTSSMYIAMVQDTADKVDIEVIDKANKIMIYPNPAHNSCIVRVDDTGANYSEIQLMDVLGRAVYKQDITNAAIKLDLSACSPGIYFVKIIGENASYTRKLVIR